MRQAVDEQFLDAVGLLQQRDSLVVGAATGLADRLVAPFTDLLQPSLQLLVLGLAQLLEFG